MTGSVESAKEAVQGVAKDVAKDASKDAPKEKAPRAARSAKVAVESTVEAKPADAAPIVAAKAMLRPRNARYAAVAAGALVVGTAFGMMTAPKPSSGDGLAQVVAALEAGRSESARLSGEVERLSKSVAALAQGNDTARGESRSLGASLNERMSKLELGLDKKFAGLAEKIEREQAAHVTGTTTPVEKRAAAPIPPAPIPAALPAAKSEPTQTGTIGGPVAEAKPDAKPKPETVETWALRDVYNGIAMLEDRRRRLIEVAPGDAVPGVGRVEGIERRGRMWVVVTKQGVITPQAW